MNEIHRMTKSVKDFAMGTGFSDCKISSADVLSDEYFRYEQWLSLGYQADLGYMERNKEKRQDISLILPGARSVIVVSYNYYTPFEHKQSEDYGKIARYAWGDDYHDVIPPKLQQIEQKIAELFPGSQCKHYTDTGAILEKQWAVKAGLGWQGKNSNVISRKYGSWFFIGVIITTAELVADSPIEDFCGTCTACLDACPTKAIVQPYVVDTGKCISYWTIEAKPDREIPKNVAEHLDGWVFGCDVCQDVCPWNRFRQPSEESRFLPRHNETSVSLFKIETMQQEEFSERFRKSPIKRTKLKGMQRNAAALKGNDND